LALSIVSFVATSGSHAATLLVDTFNTQSHTATAGNRTGSAGTVFMGSKRFIVGNGTGVEVNAGLGKFFTIGTTDRADTAWGKGSFDATNPLNLNATPYTQLEVDLGTMSNSWSGSVYFYTNDNTAGGADRFSATLAIPTSGTWIIPLSSLLSEAGPNPPITSVPARLADVDGIEIISTRGSAGQLEFLEVRLTSGVEAPTVPEPSTYALGLIGLAGLGLLAWRKRRARA